VIERDPRPDLPQDRVVDRRAFLARMTALAVAGSGAALAGPPRLSSRSASGSVPIGPRLADDHPGAYADEIRPEALTDPAELTIAEAATLIRSRDLSPLELVDAYLARIAELDPLYQAFNLVLTEQARTQARRTARQRHRGPLTGIPRAVKDNL
jgi:hypothetical protein